MRRKLFYGLLGLAIYFLSNSTTFAQGPEPQGSDLFWQASYWNNTSLTGNPILQRQEVSIDYNWGLGSPDPVVHSDQFSARWQRYIETGSGWYRFTATSDDGIRVYVDGELLIDQWNDHPPTTFSASKSLSSGHHLLKVEYYENFVGAVARLNWSALAVSGVVVVDDTSGGFLQGGTASSWRSAVDGYGGHLYWTFNNDVLRLGYNYGRWYPSLTAGRYEVFAYIPDRYTTTTNARYWISHADGYTLHPVDQSLPGPRWVSLGTFRFSGASSDYVSLSDITYEPRLSRIVAWDALKWEPR